MGTSDHAHFMRHALELAQRGWGGAQPNPLVGAVVVHDGRIVGEGWHAEYGGPHAEVNALRAAGESATGSTLYVTLEPCAHHGRTPPCTRAIIDAGVTEVVYAASDPNPLARGGGDVLSATGIAVTAGVERDAARRQNAPFFHVHDHGTTWFTLKLATSIDGRIAAGAGRRTNLTGVASRAETHRLRAGYDAVMVGIGTVLADDPMLTVRDVPARRQPTRVILDSSARLPLGAKLVRTLHEAPVVVVCGPSAPAQRVAALRSAGVTVMTADPSARGLEPSAVAAALRSTGLTSVFLEGGSRLAGSFMDAGLIGRLHLLIAPIVIGTSGVPAFAGSAEIRGYADDGIAPRRWVHAAVEHFGEDVMLTFDRSGVD